MKKGVENISVNAVRAISYYASKWFYIHNVRSNQPSGVFRHAAVQNIFENAGGRVLMLVMLVLWKLCLYLDFLVDIYEIFNMNSSSNLGY